MSGESRSLPPRPIGVWMKLSALLCTLAIVLACTSKQERLAAYQQRAETYYEQESTHTGDGPHCEHDAPRNHSGEGSGPAT